MLIAITLWAFGLVLVYLANRIGRLEVELKSTLERSSTANIQFERLLEEAVMRNFTMRELINELVSAKDGLKDQPKAELVASSPFVKTRRGRTDEEKMQASERAKQRWAERKAAAKLEVFTQPSFDESRADTRAIQ